MKQAVFVGSFLFDVHPYWPLIMHTKISRSELEMKRKWQRGWYMAIWHPLLKLYWALSKYSFRFSPSVPLHTTRPLALIAKIKRCCRFWGRSWLLCHQEQFWYFILCLSLGFSRQVLMFLTLCLSSYSPSVCNSFQRYYWIERQCWFWARSWLLCHLALTIHDFAASLLFLFTVCSS